VADYMADCDQVLVPELNYQGQFASLVQSQVARPLTRLARATGAPMDVAEILGEIRRLAGRTPAVRQAA
jgi:hypothetical protein